MTRPMSEHRALSKRAEPEKDGGMIDLQGRFVPLALHAADLHAAHAELMTRLEKAEGVLREVADPKCGWIPDAGDGHPSIDMGRAGEIARAYFAEQGP